MRLSLVAATLAACCIVVLSDSPLSADGWLFHRRQPYSWVEPSYPPAVAPPGTVMPQPKTAPAEPKAFDPMTQPAPVMEPTPQLAPMVSAALGDNSIAVSAPGYIDFAKPMNQIRLRYDAAYNMNRPDRAEFFYGKCGCFGGNAPGPILPERTVDSQEPSLYVELAPTERFSAFIDVPFRMINPDVNNNASGIGDLRFGFKYAMVYDEYQILTLQVRGFAPTGDARQGLGTNHYTIEPALLYYRNLSDRLTFYAELADWIPLDGTEFAGNVLTYGAGLGYTVYNSGNFRVMPLVEMIGWSVLDGKELDPQQGAVNASGDTIINGKLGVRAGGPRQDFYFGYGRALTGEQWYQDIWRLEYRFKF
jgi:hypothetical protein